MTPADVVRARAWAGSSHYTRDTDELRERVGLVTILGADSLAVAGRVDTICGRTIGRTGSFVLVADEDDRDPPKCRQCIALVDREVSR